MKLFWSLFILTAFIYSESVKGLKLVNNGYEDLYVVIQEAVPENVELLGRIQVSIVSYSLTPNLPFHTKGGKDALLLRHISESQCLYGTVCALRSAQKM